MRKSTADLQKIPALAPKRTQFPSCMRLKTQPKGVIKSNCNRMSPSTVMSGRMRSLMKALEQESLITKTAKSWLSATTRQKKIKILT